MDIIITARSVYGETKFYPHNYEAGCLARIAGTKTLTIETLINAKAMGCSIILDGDATLARMVPGWSLTQGQSANSAVLATIRR